MTISITGKVLVDTNVLVYVYDRTNLEKQQRATQLLDALIQQDVGVLTTQVLAEFFVTVTRKLRYPISISDASQRISLYIEAMPVIEMTKSIVIEAIRGVELYQFSFWDAQIWAAARLNQIPFVLSEDFNVGSSIERVRFINPFSSTFQMSDIDIHTV